MTIGEKVIWAAVFAEIRSQHGAALPVAIEAASDAVTELRQDRVELLEHFAGHAGVEEMLPAMLDENPVDGMGEAELRKFHAEILKHSGHEIHALEEEHGSCIRCETCSEEQGIEVMLLVVSLPE